MKKINYLTFRILYVAFLPVICSYNLSAQQYTLTDDDVVVENGIITSYSIPYPVLTIIMPQTLDGQHLTGTKAEVFKDMVLLLLKSWKVKVI